MTEEKKQDDLLHKTLKLAGFGYVLGDAAMMAASAARATKGQGAKEFAGSFSSGALWMAGGLGTAVYGNPNPDRQLTIQANKLQEFLQQKGVTIPADAREQSALLKDKNFWEKMNDYLFEHPSEILNASYALGAGLLVRQGVNELKAGTHHLLPKQLNHAGLMGISSNFWIGALVATGALVGLLVKEDPHAKEKAEHGNAVDKAVAFVTDKPLRVSAALYTVNNGFLGLKAVQDFSQRNTVHASKTIKPHVLSTLQLSAYLLSNALLSASSRSQISREGFAAGQIVELENAAASILAAQPKAVQQQLIKETSQFMAQMRGVDIPAESIAADLTARIAQAGKWQNRPQNMLLENAR